MGILNISRAIEHSPRLRTLLSPVVDIKRKFDEIAFRKTEDYEFIKSFHNKHKGEKCFIIGNGPSLTGEDLDMINGELSFACNRIYNIFDQTTWRPDYYMCSDRQALMDEIINIKKLHGPVKFLATWAKKYGRKKEDEIHYFLISGKFQPHLEKKIQKTVREDVASYFSSTQTITCTEIEFAIYMGFKEIYLLGVDHNYPISIDKNGNKTIDTTVKSHFANGGSKESSAHFIYYDAATECYKSCNEYAEKHGIKIYNATRGGKLEIFERKKLEDVVKTN